MRITSDPAVQVRAENNDVPVIDETAVVFLLCFTSGATDLDYLVDRDSALIAEFVNNL